jgi:hypothetical protein
VTVRGLIVRADSGGLAHLTLDVAEHVEHDRVLVQHGSNWNAEAVAGWLRGLDLVWSAETWYEPRFLDWAAEADARPHLYAMPELLPPAEGRLARWQKTAQPAPCMTDLPVVPFPAPTETIPFFPRGGGIRPRFLFVSCPAMADRHGWATVEAALPLVTEPCELVVHGAPVPDPIGFGIGNVHVTWRPPSASRAEVYADADVLLLPRRYGCLSLLMLEAASAGLPIVTTDLDPQRGWFGAWPELLVPTVGTPETVPMKGGLWPVYTADPEGLAARIDALVRRPDEVAALSWAFRRWALDRSWERLLPAWDNWLAG